MANPKAKPTFIQRYMSEKLCFLFSGVVKSDVIAPLAGPEKLHRAE